MGRPRHTHGRAGLSGDACSVTLEERLDDLKQHNTRPKRTCAASLGPECSNVCLQYRHKVGHEHEHDVKVHGHRRVAEPITPDEKAGELLQRDLARACSNRQFGKAKE